MTQASGRADNPHPPSPEAPADVTAPRYAIRLMFEWGGGCLWCGNDAARDAFDVGAIEDRLPFSAATRQRLEELSAWHDTALDRDDPAGASPWPPEEDARFDAAALQLLAALRAELGSGFQIVYERL
jgi:hypothetical protein